ncbi:MAG: hypothetical protein IPM57_06465 [Oligoflexia bacterium]|nr:hypothetical protein [Oligoflexia bacterium]
MKQQLSFISCLLIVMFLSFACTRPGGNQPVSKVPEKNITISTVGETMLFDKRELYVKAGEEITLTFVNNATTMKHNWLLVTPGKADEIGILGAKAGEAKQFVPESSDVLATTKLIGKGQDVIKFKAPPSGQYPYICTFPGHYTVMRGTLHSL